MFTPEFRRLDAIISFRSLDHDIIMRVVEKFLVQLDEQLAEKKVEAQFTGAQGAPRQEGLRPADGARPMARLIQDTVRRALPTSFSSASCSTAARSRSTSARARRSCSSSRKSRRRSPPSKACQSRRQGRLSAAFVFGSRGYFCATPGDPMANRPQRCAILMSPRALSQDAQKLAAPCAICHGSEGRAVTEGGRLRSQDCREEQIALADAGFPRRAAARRDAPDRQGLYRCADRPGGMVLLPEEVNHENGATSSGLRLRGGPRRGGLRQHGDALKHGSW